jgi:hypothetical protein
MANVAADAIGERYLAFGGVVGACGARHRLRAPCGRVVAFRADVAEGQSHRVGQRAAVAAEEARVAVAGRDGEALTGAVFATCAWHALGLVGEACEAGESADRTEHRVLGRRRAVRAGAADCGGDGALVGTQGAAGARQTACLPHRWLVVAGVAANDADEGTRKTEWWDGWHKTRMREQPGIRAPQHPHAPQLRGGVPRPREGPISGDVLAGALGAASAVAPWVARPCWASRCRASTANNSRTHRTDQRRKQK